MRNARIGVHISTGLSATRVLDHFIRSRGEELRDAGIPAEVFVDSLQDSRGTTFIVTIELGGGQDPTVVQETNRDAFVAARDAFLVARRWMEEHLPASAAW